MAENILDLNITHFYEKYDLQNNLKKIEQIYGNEFIIKHEINNKIILLNVKFTQKLLPNNKKFYRICYISDKRTTKLNPLMIDFIDIITNELNNNCYINDIQKINGITGTELLLTCIKICKILGVQKINLIDISTIQINNVSCNLSFIKLLQHKKTFYMKYGFDFEISHTQLPFIRYENKDMLKSKINDLIDSIRKIKIKDIIDEYEKTLDLIGDIKDNEYNTNFQIMIDNISIPTERLEIFISNPELQIDSLICESYDMLYLLDKYNGVTYLYELFIKLFENNSKDYLILQKYFIENKRTKILCDTQIISREYICDINVLLLLLQSYYYSFYFY